MDVRSWQSLIDVKATHENAVSAHNGFLEMRCRSFNSRLLLLPFEI